jgi:hypothetical protein
MGKQEEEMNIYGSLMFRPYARPHLIFTKFYEIVMNIIFNAAGFSLLVLY